MSVSSGRRPRRRDGLRLTIAVCTVSAAIAGAGCGSDDDTSSGSTGAAASPKPAKKVDVTLIQGVATDEFYITLACGARQEAAKLGVNLDVQGATTFDPATQTPILTSAIAKHPDAIVIAPTDSKALAGPLQEAKAAGIKVVLVDTGLDDTSIASAAVSSNNVEGGRQAARTIAEQVGDKGKVITIGGTPGVTTVDQRLKGFAEEMKKHTGITYLGNQPTPTGGVQQAASVTASSLSKNPDLAGVFAISTPASEGANNAIRDAGDKGKIKVVGFDAGPAQVEQLQKGLVSALIAQKAGDIGAQGVAQARKAIDGQPTTKTIGTGFVALTAATIDDPDKRPYVYVNSCG